MSEQRIIHGDCLEAMRAMEAESVDAIVTDPPYELAFMGQHWDRSIDHRAWATEALRVLKPGGHLVAFGGTRTYHRLACGLEDAGFEIRDCLAWMYGQGMSKSWNFDTRYEGVWCSCMGGGNALPYNHGKQASEHELRHLRGPDLSTADGTGEERGEVLLEGMPESRVPAEGAAAVAEGANDGGAEPVLARRVVHRAGQGVQDGPMPARVSVDVTDERVRSGASPRDGATSRPSASARGGGASHQPRDHGQPDREPEALREPPGALGDAPHGGLPRCSRCGGLREAFRGFGTGLKPCHEPAVLARKPLIGSVALNVTTHGTGGINVDGCRVGTDGGTEGAGRGPQGAVYGDGLNGERGQPVPGLGRWPGNVLLDEEAARMLDEEGPESTSAGGSRGESGFWKGLGAQDGALGFGDTGGRARFFYTAKASRAEREAGCEMLPAKPGGVRNNHPTLKPVALMRWLVRLVTPPGGVVLDPFLGSGTTLLAAFCEGFDAIGIEREDEYVEIARARLRHWRGLPPEAREPEAEEERELGPLFAGVEP